MAVLLLSGAGWFMHYTHHTLYAAWVGAVAPFLPGEFIKVLVAAGVYSALSRAPAHLMTVDPTGISGASY